MAEMCSRTTLRPVSCAGYMTNLLRPAYRTVVVSQKTLDDNDASLLNCLYLDPKVIALRPWYQSTLYQEDSSSWDFAWRSGPSGCDSLSWSSSWEVSTTYSDDLYVYCGPTWSERLGMRDRATKTVSSHAFILKQLRLHILINYSLYTYQWRTVVFHFTLRRSAWNR